MELPVVIDEPDEMQKIDEKDEDDEQDYLHEVETMLIMLASMRDATKQQHFCDECRDDITCDPADAEKSFLSAAHLTRHRASYHSPKNRSKRFLKASKMEQIVAGSRNCFRCVWPAQCEPDLEDDEEADDNLDKTAGELPVKLSRRSYRYKVQMLQHIVNAHTNGEVPQELLDCFREEIASNSSKAGRSGRQDVDSGEGDEGDEEMTEPRVLEDGQDSEDEDDLCCSECLCDPSFTPETRPGSFASAASLRKHRQAKLHSPQARAIRMLKKDGGKSISLSTSTCPYCKQFVGSLLQVCEHIVSMAHLSLPLPVLGVYEALLQSLDEHRPQHASPEDQRAALDAVFANWGAFPSTTPGEDFFRPWYKSGEALWWEVAPQDLDIQSMAAQWGEMDVDSEQQAWGVHDDWGSFVPL
ncbi:hypothetical protein C8R45DRAFT_132904 [Mycena sanguinolenta]|nr:hypothetical protein C8R45DRAFT_132904 [Mycena sanguinolenta]